MIRAATLSDLPRLYELMLEAHRSSKFYPDVGVDDPTMRSIIMTSVQRHGGTNNGSTCYLVEDVDGVLEGFVIGILDRVYHIGNRLCANDLFLFCTPKARARAGSQLIDGYIEWAAVNPKVAHIMLSWTDVNGTDGKAIEKLYDRKGFHRVGAIWERAGQ